MVRNSEIMLENQYKPVFWQNISSFDGSAPGSEQQRGCSTRFEAGFGACGGWCGRIRRHSSMGLLVSTRTGRRWTWQTWIRKKRFCMINCESEIFLGVKRKFHDTCQCYPRRPNCHFCRFTSTAVGFDGHPLLWDRSEGWSWWCRCVHEADESLRTRLGTVYCGYIAMSCLPVYHQFLMVGIPPIKIVMNGGWFIIAIPTVLWHDFGCQD